jgi:hypothetical protein
MSFDESITERTAALEELWAAVKDWRGQPLGYSPKIAQAVQRIDNLERKADR